MEALDVPEPSTGATVAERRLLWWRRILVNSVFVVAWYVLLFFLSLSGAGARDSGLENGLVRRCVQIARAHADPGRRCATRYALARRRRRQRSSLLHALVDPLRALRVRGSFVVSVVIGGTDILIRDGRQRPAASAHVVARQLEIAHILYRSYHISPASLCPSVLTARGRRRRGAKHDPNFRPFLPSRSPSSSSCYSPPRASFDLPMPIVSAPPPSKAERRAARRDLDPVLREAVRAHERQLAQARRPSWLSRRKPQIDAGDEDDVHDVPVFDDDDDYDTPVETPKRAPRRDRIRLQLVSLELRVDLAVFRAKKRLRARFGLS